MGLGVYGLDEAVQCGGLVPDIEFLEVSAFCNSQQVFVPEKVNSSHEDV